jgi:hypothetical protein
MLSWAWILPFEALAQLPPLGTLVVTMTSPASGATVAGTVTVSASVSIVGSLVVAGVQFQLDGGNLGTEDTTAPYSISWDTPTTSNGSHTLRAVARDLLGVRFTSEPVTVTVSNGPPPDTTAPTVAITTPSDGTTVSGAITVTASATDAGGVRVVQFLVDGVELGRDTTAPYEAAWDTQTVADGTHTLQARAQDTAGNIGTSAVATVTVANGAPPPPGTAERFEETDPSVVLSAGWTASSSARWSGGTASFSATAGARATFTFTGTSVSWIGFRGPMAGIARVMLDGALVGELDTFAPTYEEFRVVAFTRKDLAAGSHTLMIEVTGQKNSASTDAFIVVDAFDAPAPTVTRFQETDRSITYTAGWTSPGGMWSGGTAAVSTTTGARATFIFTGTSVSWIGFRGPQAGIARVMLDGVLVGDVDLFAPSEDTQVFVFTASGLADASHTLAIEVTGLKNSASTDTVIAVDAFEVTSSSPQTTVSRFEDTNPSVAFTDGWFGNADPRWSGGMAALSTTAGAQATFTFTGTSVSWIGFRGPQTGIARVFLDGVLVGDVDTFAPTEESQAVVFTRGDLAAGSHTLTIEVTGLKNAASTDTFIVVDAFDVPS